MKFHHLICFSDVNNITYEYIEWDKLLSRKSIQNWNQGLISQSHRTISWIVIIVLFVRLDCRDILVYNLCITDSCSSEALLVVVCGVQLFISIFLFIDYIVSKFVAIDYEDINTITVILHNFLNEINHFDELSDNHNALKSYSSLTMLPERKRHRHGPTCIVPFARGKTDTIQFARSQKNVWMTDDFHPRVMSSIPLRLLVLCVQGSLPNGTLTIFMQFKPHFLDTLFSILFFYAHTIIDTMPNIHNWSRVVFCLLQLWAMPWWPSWSPPPPSPLKWMTTRMRLPPR